MGVHEQAESTGKGSHREGAERSAPRHGLVLAGGGVTGIAWHIGVVSALYELGVDLVSWADLIVGTSAGATAAAQISSDVPIAELLEQQRSATHSEIVVDYDSAQHQQLILGLIEGAMDGLHARRLIGEMSLTAETVTEATRRTVIAARIPRHEWPTKPLLLTAVDAATGTLTCFDNECGVDLVDAVAASCAVPGVWPPVTIGERRYVDGGLRSLTNADLAAPCQRVLVLVPMQLRAVYQARLAAELERLRPEASLVLAADRRTIDVIGSNSLDPELRGAAAAEGWRQAHEAISDLRSLTQADPG
jgi:NTE family protein